MSGDDAAVIARARAGDGQAFAEIVRRYQRRVYGAALHILGAHSDAEDVAQEAFVRAYRGIERFDGRSELFTWLYRITVNVALNHLRSAARQRRLAKAGAERVAHHGGRPEDPGRTPPDPADGAAITRRTRRVFEAMAELSEPLRVTLVLATVEALPYRQVAEILDIPEGTVAWRVNEARKQLRSRLAALEGQAESRGAGKSAEKNKDEQAV